MFHFADQDIEVGQRGVYRNVPVCREEVPRRLRVEESRGDKVEGDADDVEDGEAAHVEDGGGEGGDEQAQGEQEVADDGQAGAVARQARLGGHQLRMRRQ